MACSVCRCTKFKYPDLEFCQECGNCEDHCECIKERQMNNTAMYEFLQVYGAITRAQIRAQGMTAENEQRKVTNCSMAYSDSDFERLIEEEGIGVNQVTLAARRVLEAS